MSYARFGLMIAVSTLFMYPVMYLNTYAWDHVAWSQTRGWMTLLMGAVMAIVMIALMWGMYPSPRANWAIVAVASVVGLGALAGVRSQRTVDDVAWMTAMIPHHSIAVLTSTRAQIRDPRVRALADGILAAQLREIDEMHALIADLRANPAPAGAPLLPPNPDPDAD